MATVLVPQADPAPHPASDLLRFSTAGSVDDGKSTLIGRLLHDSNGILDDQVAALERVSRRRGSDGIDLALLTDGLRAEREQGITIDVAYRYFSTARRRFIIADNPGHVQYTRNMVTGCSTSDLAVVLVDARTGPTEQTRRHVVIAALLGVPHLLLAVNKMDLVGFDRDAFDPIAAEMIGLAQRMGVPETTAIPISALLGDNVVERSSRMPWFMGRPVLEHLELVDRSQDRAFPHLRLPIQWVIRTSAGSERDYRGYAGRVEAGVLRRGDAVLALPSGIATEAASIERFGESLDEARRAESVAVRLRDDVDLGRGGMLVGIDGAPEPQHELDALVCWLGEAPLVVGQRYALTHTTRDVRAVVAGIVHRLDVRTLELDTSAGHLAGNDIGRVRLSLGQPVFADAYRANRTTGSAILVDETSNATVGAVLIQPAGEAVP